MIRIVGVRQYCTSVSYKRGLKRDLNGYFNKLSIGTPYQQYKKVILDGAQGDFQITLLNISKPAKVTPEEVFETISKQITENSFISRIYYTPPGFLNIELKNELISDQLDQLCTGRLSVETEEKKNILVDYASPNMCKELHVGHLRSAVLGESVSRILEFLGHNVDRVSHVGDFGTPIGLVLAQALETDPTLLSETNTTDASQLSLLYTTAKARSKTDPDFNLKVASITSDLQKEIINSQRAVKQDSKYLQYYNTLCDISRRSFTEIYSQLGVGNILERGESYYASRLESVVEELDKKGLVTESEGAKCIFVKGFKNPFIVQKSDGGYLYSTTDLAALRYRTQELNKDRIIIITDSSQKFHFQQLFQVGSMAGWLNKCQVSHLSFGVMQGENGQKLSSRDGAPYPLSKLLNDSVLEAKKTLQVSANARNAVKTPEEEETISRAVAFAAIKYYDLWHPKDYVFNYSEMLNYKGKTGVYILYALTRISSILRKSNFKDMNQILATPVKITTPEERTLAVTLLKFTDVLLDIQSSLSPVQLCEYLFTLTSTFHLFYEKVPVVGSPEELQRLKLILATEKVVSQGCHLLGLETVTKM